ncbi:hypothetical protein REC12_10000 [Desulfosporosinus sp. PR]|uniref:hypothetical protein n=1 Tax=Candidatus Desulfosporosinus nitrosoreducens TaxID=3401928 RepID=UPI0027F801E8|nr:hypothetical protein [Desulfosporosinus sp. PR]MDQ7093921.1 hypothetical protein [Desulfosporosinus sp. PR]
MVYQVCALVATIILGMLGIELILWLHSLRKLTDEAKHAIRDINTYMPSLLEDVKVMTNLVRHTTEQVGGAVTEAAVGLERLRKDPLYLITGFLGTVKQLMALWQEFRGRKNEASERE